MSYRAGGHENGIAHFTDVQFAELHESLQLYPEDQIEPGLAELQRIRLDHLLIDLYAHGSAAAGT